ncbi:MAG: GNAT family N-acetyltransferase [Bacteroidales bacterium]
MQNTIEIKPAKENQLIEVLYLIRECAEQLALKGIKSWHNTHSDSSLISDDIKKKNVFLAFLRMVPIGTITVKACDDMAEAALIDRLAIFPYFQNRGFAKDLLVFAEESVRNNNYKKLCATVPFGDKSLLKLFENNGFVNKGPASECADEMSWVMFEKNL